ncbi:LysR substrate-binding domain-containing protein [Frigidibacter sp. MR17.14]|uniref:LysR family transcriptional regulator n=1 Tax=Frigidibacter sp. MR17.14 TaxID=3126509 RepID=UPI003012D058
MRIRFELSDMEAFRVLSEHLSYVKAADELGMSASALTRRIQRLEESLGSELLRRSTRKVQLTLSGERVRDRAVNLLGDMEELFLAVRGEELRAPPVVTIASVLSATRRLLPPGLSAFRQRHPNTIVRVMDCTASEIIDAVRSGEADFGVHYLGTDDPELEFHPVITDHFVLACPLDHVLAQRGSITWRELADEPLITVWKGSGIRMMMDFELAKFDLSIRTGFEVRHAQTAAELAAAGLGVAALPGLTAALYPNLRMVPLNEPRITRVLGTLRHARRKLSRGAAELLSLIDQTNL